MVNLHQTSRQNLCSAEASRQQDNTAAAEPVRADIVRPRVLNKNNSLAKGKCKRAMEVQAKRSRWECLRRTLIAMAVLELLLLQFQLVLCILEIISGDNSTPVERLTTEVPLSVLAFVLPFAAVILCVVGLSRRSPVLLVPHLVVQSFVLVKTVLTVVQLSAWLLHGFNVHITIIAAADADAAAESESDSAPSSGTTQMVEKRMEGMLWALIAILCALSVVQITFILLVISAIFHFHSISKKEKASDELEDNCASELAMSSLMSSSCASNRTENDANENVVEDTNQQQQDIGERLAMVQLEYMDGTAAEWQKQERERSE